MGPGWIAHRYRIVDELGRGAAGTVWLAYDETLRRDVALRPIPSHEPPERLPRLSHPNVVAVHDVVVDDGQPWLVMEYVAGRTLADLVAADGPLDARRAARIGAALARALAAAHDSSLVHGDVTPSAVRLDARDRPRLDPFGIARSEADPAFAAPEVARGAAPTRASDVWSLAATVCFAVEGQPPNGVTAPRRDGVLTPTLRRLLTPEPRNRPASEVAADLFDVATSPAAAEPATPAPTPRRSRARLIAAAVAALVAGGGATWLLWPDGSADGRAAITTPSAASASSPPSLSPPSSSDTTPSAGQMATFVAAHYAWLPHDPVAAWDEFSGAMQASVSYTGYVAFWSTVEALATSGLTVDQASMTVRVTLTYVTTAGAKLTEEHRLRLVVDPEYPGDLVIDSDTRLA